jgi:hypothetical protein
MSNDVFRFFMFVFLAIALTYVVNKYIKKIRYPNLDKISPAVTMQCVVILWYGIIVLRAVVISHFHLFASVFINLTHILFLLAGLIWLVKKPSREPMILLIAFQIAGIVMNYAALFSFSLEGESSMIVIALSLRVAAIYSLVKAVRSIKPV